PITEKSGVAKSIIYQLLEKLIQKGLVSYITKEKTRYYQASDPHKLIEYIEENEKKLAENKNKIENLIPTLLAKQNQNKEQTATIYEGFKGMIAVHEHTYLKLEKGDEFFYLGIAPEQPEHFHAYWQRDHLRRAKAGIHCKLLFHPNTDKKILKNRNSYKLCDARYMPTEINTPAWIMGYKDVTVIGFPSSNPITLEIVNQEIADSFKSYFEEFWKKSKKFK
ncbi:MAG TPA: helix-turn-helix domain-containing protein, partial [Candidatus Nanoarchaeia archaeon]|nr:helix-turn-helix domain-containing protein [Candidatus Nanoarchaeia archaeon]